MFKKVVSALLIIVVICSMFCIFGIGLANAKKKSLNSVEKFKASALTSGSVKLTWQKVTGANGYLIYRYNSKNNKWIRISKLSSSSKLVSGLKEGTKYVFAIKAYSATKNRTVFSKSLSKAVTVTPLKSINAFKANARWHRIVLTWDKNASAQTYIIYKRVNNKWKVLKRLNPSANKYNIKNLKANSNFTFGIKACKKIKNQTVSSEKMAVLSTKTRLPSVKKVRSVFADSKVRLKWNKLEHAKAYKIYSYDYSSAKWSFVAKTKSTTFVKSYLKTATVYKFGIVPVKSGKKVSAEDMAITTGKTIPADVKYSVSLKNGLLKFKWKKQNNVKGYIVYTKQPGKKWKKLTATSKTSCEVKAPESEKFYVSVKAYTKYKGKVLSGMYLKKSVQSQPYSYKLYCDGDSISAGKGSNGYSYAAIFAERHNMSLKNYAVSGGTISSNVKGKYHIAQGVINHLSNSYDYIFFDGGVNDYIFSAKLGKKASASQKKFDMNTTCGAFEAMLTFTKKTCPNAKIYFISVHKVYADSKKNSLGFTYNDYRKALESICKKYNVTVVDCYNASFNFAYTFKRNGIYPKGDKLHPTEQGYIKFYLPVLEKVVRVGS